MYLCMYVRLYVCILCKTRTNQNKFKPNSEMLKCETFVLLGCYSAQILNYIATLPGNLTYLLTYLLHGAESLLRS